jgi:hypothetical protein
MAVRKGNVVLTAVLGFMVMFFVYWSAHVLDLVNESSSKKGWNSLIASSYFQRSKFDDEASQHTRIAEAEKLAPIEQDDQNDSPEIDVEIPKQSHPKVDKPGVSHSRLAQLRKFKKSVIDAIEPWLNVTVVDSSPGNLTSIPARDRNCNGANWMLFSGHLRSFPRNYLNRQSFMENSASGCWMQVVYTVDIFETPQKLGMWKIKDVTSLSRLTLPQSEDVAFVVVQRHILRGKPDVFPGVLGFSKIVAAYHGIPLSPKDVLIVTRPDVIFTHAIDYPSLKTYAQNAKPFVFWTRYFVHNFDTKDPAEFLLIGTRELWENLCIRSCPTWWHIRTRCRGEQGCIGDNGCGFYGPKFIIAAEVRGFDSFFFLLPGFGMMLNRIPSPKVIQTWKSPKTQLPVRGVLDVVPARMRTRDSGACDYLRVECGRRHGLEMIRSISAEVGGAQVDTFVSDGLKAGYVRNETLIKMFKIFDSNGDGVLSKSEIVKHKKSPDTIVAGISKMYPPKMQLEGVKFSRYAKCDKHTVGFGTSFYVEDRSRS